MTAVHETRASETSTMTSHELKNGGRIVKFVGELLARVSSHRSSSPRWTVMELYRTEPRDDGRYLYVIHKIGCTTVYHSSDCKMARTNKLLYGHELKGGVPDLAKMQRLAPCVSCAPQPEDPVETLRFERERHWAGVAETPEAAVEMCHRNDNGARSLPWIAANLLELASEQDEALSTAYSLQQL